MEIGERIKECRLQLRLSQSELARFMGVSSSAVRHWELPEKDKQSARPSMKNLALLAHLLEVEVNWLATGKQGASGEIDEVSVTFNEQELLQLINGLTEEQKKALFVFLKTFK